jgi:hypothetical protein
MIWIIASIPFWIIAFFCAAFAVFAVLFGAFHPRIDSDRFASASAGAFFLLLLAGASGLIAAKICS